ncbi:MAG: hypothetical protein Q8N03_12900 [Ignavibacteria bacterium]|nr:hypothetical protein [Ignavibacteria bacterium]
MLTKNRIKREIDTLPDDLLEKVYKFISRLKSVKTDQKKIKTYKLLGQYDNINVREKAYE